MRSSSAGGAGELVSGDIPVAGEESGALVSGETPAEGACTCSADAAAPSERSAAGEGASAVVSGAAAPEAAACSFCAIAREMRRRMRLSYFKLLPRESVTSLMTRNAEGSISVTMALSFPTSKRLTTQ